MLDAQDIDDRFDVNERGRFPFDVIARPGVILMAGHTGDAVVQDDTDGIRAVIGHIGQGIDARMEERRIAHADGQVLGVERRRPA